MLSYDIINVFIADGQKYSGNPLAVIYGAADLTQEQCQTLGRQFNLSEITFPYNVQKTSYSVRIFTPGSELPFAGHPTLGTCFALIHQGLDSKSGEAVQTSLSGETKLYFPQNLQPPTVPARICMRASSHFVTARLPQNFDRIPAIFGHQEQHAQFVRRASCGLPWLYARFDSPDAVVNSKVSSSHLQSYSDELRGHITAEEARDTWVTGLVAFAVIGNTEEGLEIKARVFFIENDILTEDSATGSAALGLGLVLHAEDMVTSIAPKYKILQGYEALKPSQLYGEVVVEDGKAVGVRVAGDAVKVGSGQMEIP